MADGEHRTSAGARYPAALCTAILGGVAAQRAREGHPIPRHVQARLDAGRAVCALEEERPEMLERAALALEAHQRQEGYPDDCAKRDGDESDGAQFPMA